MEEEEDLLKVIRSNKLFSSLDKKACKKLITKFDKIYIRQDQILFHQGDVPDGLYLLLSGKLSAFFTSATGETKTLGHIESGETVGELGALSNDIRTLTVKAVKDSILLKLSAKEFMMLCHEYPMVLFGAINPIIMRSEKIIRMFASEKSKKRLVIIPANKEISLAQFSEALSKYTAKLSSVIFVSDYDAEVKDSNEADLLEKITTIEKTKQTKQKILYLLKSVDSHLAKIAFKKMDMVYVVGRGQSANISRSVLDVLKKFRFRAKVDPELILLHLKNTRSPQYTENWLKITTFGLNHHVRQGIKSDYQRLLRFIRGKAVGVVLAGGGTRGFAHLGVIKALKEAKIPIDVIGGASVGAIVAGCYAMNQTYEGTRDDFTKIVEGSRGSVSWRSLTWPYISLFNAKKFTLIQQQVFKGKKIEDLWLPYFCMTSNLKSNTDVTHCSGFLWEKIRASSSIPGIIPPMIFNGELHFDGALLNNLPVDVMRKLVGPKGKVIAVELGNNAVDENYYQFPPIITFWDSFLEKIGIRQQRYVFPSFADTFLRAISMGATLRARQNSALANVVLMFDLSEFSMLHADLKDAEKMIELSYHETIKQISRIKSTKKSELQKK